MQKYKVTVSRTYEIPVSMVNNNHEEEGLSKEEYIRELVNTWFDDEKDMMNAEDLVSMKIEMVEKRYDYTYDYIDHHVIKIRRSNTTDDPINTFSSVKDIIEQMRNEGLSDDEIIIGDNISIKEIL